jgi:hypothetical protein
LLTALAFQVMAGINVLDKTVGFSGKKKVC